MKSEVQDKIMPMAEAVKKFVFDGCTLSIACVAEPCPYAGVHEIIRQRKRDLTIIETAAGLPEIEQLAGTGCVKRFITGFVARLVSGERAFDRFLRKFKIEMEDYTNYTMSAMLFAGAMGLPCYPAPKSIVCSDIYKKRGFLGEDKIRVIDNPFKNGEKIALLPALVPDVALVHVQRIDRYGNAQAWGPLSNMKWGALAARKIIVSAEELVEHEVVKLSPNYTIIPSYRVSAICIEPWGAHPTSVVGYYVLDYPFGALYAMSAMSEDGFNEWMGEWIFNVNNRAEYIQHYIEKFGYPALERLKVKYYPTSTVNIGGTFKSYFEEFGFTREMVEQAPDLFEVEVE